MTRAFWCTCILLLALACAPVESRAPRPAKAPSAPRVETAKAPSAAEAHPRGPTPSPIQAAPAANSAETPNATLTGTVARVVDGDTLRVDLPQGQEKVRLIGMDTPEMRPPQPFGPEATRAAERLCPPGTAVRLELDVQTRDRYGRLLAYVYLPDGRMLNAEMLKQGLATVMTIPPNVRHADDFLKIQQKARADQEGMWAESAGQDGSEPEANRAAGGLTP